MNDTSPESVDALVERIKSDNATATTYISNYNTGVERAYNITSRKESYNILILIHGLGSIDYYYCSAKHSQPHDIVSCLGLDPAKTNLLYFTGEFVPGVLDETANNDDDN